MINYTDVSDNGMRRRSYLGYGRARIRRAVVPQDKVRMVDSGSCRVNDAIARKLDKVFYGKESSSVSIKELFARAKQANQMQDYPNAERTCLEILKQNGLPLEEAQGAIAMLFSAL